MNSGQRIAYILEYAKVFTSDFGERLGEECEYVMNDEWLQTGSSHAFLRRGMQAAYFFSIRGLLTPFPYKSRNFHRFRVTEIAEEGESLAENEGELPNLIQARQHS